MTTEDDEWALENLRQHDRDGGAFGIGSYRWKDKHGVVHRMIWTKRTRGWASLCDMPINREIPTFSTEDAVSCITCLCEGA